MTELFAILCTRQRIGHLSPAIHPKSLSSCEVLCVHSIYCKTINFRVRFILRIFRPQQICKNNGSRIFKW